jgi:hypothetical protein
MGLHGLLQGQLYLFTFIVAYIFTTRFRSYWNLTALCCRSRSWYLSRLLAASEHNYYLEGIRLVKPYAVEVMTCTRRRYLLPSIVSRVLASRLSFPFFAALAVNMNGRELGWNITCFSLLCKLYSVTWWVVWYEVKKHHPLPLLGYAVIASIPFLPWPLQKRS